MLKKLFLLIFCINSFNSWATSYFVKLTGNGNGTSISTPMAYSSFLAIKNNVTGGDIVSFNKGDIYPGVFPITQNSGTSNTNRITYTSFGTGNNPQWNGLTTLSGWTAQGTIPNLYYTNLDVFRLQVVLFDGALVTPGRYPKTGWLRIDSHVDGVSITSSGLTNLPINPVPGTAVVRKARYVLDRHPITAKNGSTISIVNDDSLGATSINGMTDQNGFFIQDNINCATQISEYYYNNPSNRLYMNFGGTLPTAHTVQVATTFDLVNAAFHSYITFSGLDFVGTNGSVFNVQYADHINIVNCTSNFATDVVFGLQGAGALTIDGNTFRNTLSTAIYTYEADNYTITNNTIRNSGNFRGLTRSGDLAGSGISVTGDDHYIAGNTVINSGYSGISFYATLRMINNVLTNIGGNGVKVENNFIDTFCTIKDDGGGIYTFGQTQKTFRGRTIRNNIVMHGIGDSSGLSPVWGGYRFAAGIYCDNFASNVNVYNNLSASNNGAGIFWNSVNNDTATNNTLFNNEFAAFYASHLPNQVVNRWVVQNNQFIAGAANQKLMLLEMYMPLSNIGTTSNSTSGFGIINNNTYFRPFGNTSYIEVDDRQSGRVVNDMTLAQWRTNYAKDLSSVNSTATLPNNSINDFRVLYNFSNAPTTKTFSTEVYKNLSSTTFSGNRTLAAYTGEVLIYSGALIVPPTGPGLPGYKLRNPLGKYLVAPNGTFYILTQTSNN